MSTQPPSKRRRTTDHPDKPNAAPVEATETIAEIPEATETTTKPDPPPMEIGIFIPIGNNGWLISDNSPTYLPTFALNKSLVLAAEHYGLDFALSMIKLRGFGGRTEHWDYNLESFTLMAGLAAVTKRIKLFASTAILTLPPAVCARMAVTVDSIAPGRFGVNIVTGWQAAEYEQMSQWFSFFYLYLHSGLTI